jgi:hypothetical protein
MILEKYKVITVNHKNKKYWWSKGYKFNVENLPIELEIKVSDLSKGSPLNVQCKCDNCGVEYTQRFSRNTNTCSSCRTSKRMKGNTLGSKNQTLSIDTFTFEQDLQKFDSLTELANAYDVSLQVIRGYIQRNNIDVPKYFGNKRKDIDINQLKQDCESKLYTLSEIKQKHNINTYTIRRLSEEYSFSLPKTQFEKWEQQYKKLINNYDFFSEQNETKTLKQIAIEQNCSIEQLKKLFREHDELILKRHCINSSQQEKEIVSFIRSIYSGEILQNTRSIISPLELDIVIPEFKLAIEFNGIYWHSNLNDNKYHLNKTEMCEDVGYHLFHIFENEWNDLTKQEIWKSMIRNKLLCNIEKIGARQCVIKTPSNIEVNRFLNENHLQGFANSKVKYGLYYKDELVSLMTFIQSRYDKTYDWELSRFCNKKNISVIGSFSKLLNHFKKKNQNQTIVSYANRRWAFNNNNVYKKNNGSFLAETNPNYYYWNKKTNQLESRLKYQKHKLKNILDDFDETISEKNNMIKNDYRIIFDSGNIKYSL